MGGGENAESREKSDVVTVPLALITLQCYVLLVRRERRAILSTHSTFVLRCSMLIGEHRYHQR